MCKNKIEYSKYEREYSKFAALDTFIDMNWNKLSQEDYAWCLDILRTIVKRINEE